MDPKTVLIVDDNMINRMILKEILSSEYTVLEARNGAEALLQMDRHPGAISVIMLDLVMPVMDGFTFLGELAKRKEDAGVPVIVTTGSDDSEVEERLKRLGIFGMVRKPYEPDLVCDSVQRAAGG